MTTKPKARTRTVQWDCTAHGMQKTMNPAPTWLIFRVTSPSRPRRWKRYSQTPNTVSTGTAIQSAPSTSPVNVIAAVVSEVIAIAPAFHAKKRPVYPHDHWIGEPVSEKWYRGDN